MSPASATSSFNLCRAHPLPTQFRAQCVNLLLPRPKISIVLEGLAVGGERLRRLPERFVARCEIDVGNGVIRGPSDGLAVGAEGLTVALLLVVHQAEIVVGVGIRGVEGNGTTISRFSLGVGSQGSIGQTEEQMGGVMTGLPRDGLSQGDHRGVSFVVAQVTQA